MSYDNKIATRKDSGDTVVLYSSTSSCTTGHPITFKVIEMGETSPFDCVGISLDNSNTDTLQRDDAILVTKSGRVISGSHVKNWKILPP